MTATEPADGDTTEFLNQQRTVREAFEDVRRRLSKRLEQARRERMAARRTADEGRAG